MLRNVRSIVLGILAALSVPLISFPLPGGLLSEINAKQRNSPAGEHQNICCDQECRKLLAGFRRGTRDDFRTLKEVSLRFPCDQNCQLAKSLWEIKRKDEWWAANPALLPGPYGRKTDSCFPLLEGKKVSGPSVVVEVWVDAEGNPQKVTLLRGISEESFNQCVQDALLSSCYRPAFKDGRFLDAKVIISVNICFR